MKTEKKRDWRKAIIMWKWRWMRLFSLSIRLIWYPCPAAAGMRGLQSKAAGNLSVQGIP